MHIRKILQWSTDRLLQAGVDTPELDSALLLGHCLKKSRTALYLMAEDPLDSEVEKQFRALLKRRERREPLAYIIGVQEFWSLDFAVTPDVLIPRPETELLLEASIASWRQQPQRKGAILDLCTGSGVIAIVLAKELQQPVLAIDYSMAALCVARENAKRHGVSHLISFIQSDLLSTLKPIPQFSMVVSNPPYVSQQEMQYELQPEVEFYEPHLALDGGEGGMRLIQRIHDELSPVLLKDALFLMEIGSGQGDAVTHVFSAPHANGDTFRDLHVGKDYNDHDRIFRAKL